MASEQIKDLIAEAAKLSAPVKEIEVVDQPVEVAARPIAPPKEPLKDEPQASDILAAKDMPLPKPNEAPSGTSHVLKTRKQLIEKITEVCQSRGVDPKPMNLKRRRKNSLQGILQEQFREAVQKETMPQTHPDLEPLLPEGMEARTKFAVDMAFRLDMTLSTLLERGIDMSGDYHGLTAKGFVKHMETNPTLVSEIRSAWLEIISEPDNEWILDTCTATMRLALCHGYGLLNVLRAQEQKKVHAVQKEVRFEAVPPMGPPRASNKLRDALQQRKASRKNHPLKIPLHPGARGVVKSV